MAKRGKSGSSIILNNEIHFKGEKTQVRSHGEISTPVNRSEIVEPVNANAFVPALLGAIPVCQGDRIQSSWERQILGGIPVCSTVEVTKDSQTSAWQLKYPLSLLKVVDGAYVKKGTLNKKDSSKLIKSTFSQMLKNGGPVFSNWTQVLQDAMEQETLAGALKGMEIPACAIIGDPVNANTGNFIYEKEDLLIEGSLPLRFKRTYNRIDTRTGCMGKGWSHNYEIRLMIESDRYIILWEDGREELYLRDEDNSAVPLFGGFCRLSVNDMGFMYVTQDKQAYTFDNRGILLKQEDSREQYVKFLYDNYGRLSCVRNGQGASIYYKYDNGSGMLIQVSDDTGRAVTLIYELGRLKEIRNPMGESYIYSYDSDKNLYQIRNPIGIQVLENSYDTNGRIVKQAFADGGEIVYHYQEELSRTLVTDQNGHKLAYVHDERFRNIQTIYEDGEEQFFYNEQNQLIKKIDKKGNVTKFSYDRQGNTSQIIYADGEKHNMYYDCDNHLLSLSINGIEKCKNIYDIRGNLIKTWDALGRCREMEYDEKGNIIKIMNPDGSEVNMEYNSFGLISRKTNEAGNPTFFEYDNCGRIIRTINRNGYATCFSYDSSSHITSVINEAGECRTYEYKKNGKVAKITDYNKSVISWEYNEMNQVKSITMPDGGTIFLEYDQAQYIKKKILPNKTEITYTYDGLNRLKELTFPNGRMEKYEYDPNGNCITIIDFNGNRTTMEYDERDRLIKYTTPADASTMYKYDMEGHLVCITNAAGKKHTYSYDKAGNIISETDILGNSTLYDYNELDQIICVTDPKKRRPIYEYYPGGILSKKIYPDNSYEIYSYDKNGNLTRCESNKGDYLEFSYNCINWLINVRSSFEQEINFTYNAAGRITSVKNALGQVTYYEYSAEGKLISVIDAQGNRTEYAYDIMGNLIAVCQHEGKDTLLDVNIHNYQTGFYNKNFVHFTHYKRNLFGEIETITDPLGFQEHFTYDLAGRMILKKDRAGYETHFAYNMEGYLEEINYGEGRKVTFAYNSLKHLVEVQDWLGVTQIVPDDIGRTKKVIDYKGRETTYQWGMMGERRSIKYPNGKRISYEYDSLSRLQMLIDGEQEIKYGYNEDGRLSEKIFPNGIASRYSYNSMGLLNRLVHEKDGQILEEYEYEYDGMCNKAGIRKRRRIVNCTSFIPDGVNSRLLDENGYYQYKYDKLNRLTEVRKNREVLCRYEYDTFGNRIRKRMEKGDVCYYYNAASQLIKSEGIQPETTYRYDSRGNMTTVYQGTKIVNNYVYDVTNRLVAASHFKGETARYQYDGLGNRVGMQEFTIKNQDFENQDLIEYITLESLVKETEYMLDMTKQNSNLLVKTEKIYGAVSNQDYTWDYGAVLMKEGESSYIFLQNEQGSIVRLVNIQENQHIIYGYDEFGQDLYGSCGNVQPFGYTGYQIDGVSNTYFAQAREYIPQLGRFGGEDVNRGFVGLPSSLNLFPYANSNPLSYVDFDGKISKHVIKPAMSNRYLPNSMNIAVVFVTNGLLLLADWTVPMKRKSSNVLDDIKMQNYAVICNPEYVNAAALTPQAEDASALAYNLDISAELYKIKDLNTENHSAILTTSGNSRHQGVDNPFNPIEIQAWNVNSITD